MKFAQASIAEDQSPWIRITGGLTIVKSTFALVVPVESVQATCNCTLRCDVVGGDAGASEIRWRLIKGVSVSTKAVVVGGDGGGCGGTGTCADVSQTTYLVGRSTVTSGTVN